MNKCFEPHCSFFASVLVTALTAVVIGIASLSLATPPAYGDELSDAKEELSAQVAKLDELTARIEELDSQIDEKANTAIELEGEIAEKQEAIGELTVFFYKNPSTSLLEFLLASENISQMLSRAEFLYDYTEDLVQMAREEQEMSDALHVEIDSLSVQKDEQVAAQEELQGVVNDLEAKVDELTAEQRAKLAQGTTFATDFSDDGSWQSGKASAYGGPTDNAGNVTANGDTVSGSIGVAVPMNQRQYLGRKVEVSYGGKSVICICNDVGGFGGWGRALDLNYNVIVCFGYNSCNSWGVRTVQYRWL